MKVFKENSSNNNIQGEIKVCNYLVDKGYPVSGFLKNKQDEYISKLDSEKSYHIQHFIEGEIWQKNSAPLWLLESGIDYISRIHNELGHMELKRRKPIERINDKEYHLKRIDLIIDELIKMNFNGNIELCIEDLCKRKEVIENQSYIDLEKLTYVNGHSDYSVTKIITSGQQITGIIDMSEVAYIPAIWDIMRFYLNSAPEFKTGQIDKNILKSMLETYTENSSLSSYDIGEMYNFNYNYMCQAVSVYEKFIQTGEEKFISRAKNRIKQIDQFEKCKDCFDEISEDWDLIQSNQNEILE